MRENMTHLVQNRKVVRWVIATAVILLLPLVAMLFQIQVLDPGGSAEAVNWQRGRPATSRTGLPSASRSRQRCSSSGSTLPSA